LPPEAERPFVAYCGKYTFDGTKLVTQVDGASNTDLLSDQVRHIRFEGSRRMTAVPVSRLFGRSGGIELVLGAGRPRGVAFLSRTYLAEGLAPWFGNNLYQTFRAIRPQAIMRPRLLADVTLEQHFGGRGW
jgi:hypothetical protein